MSLLEIPLLASDFRRIVSPSRAILVYAIATVSESPSL